MSRNTLWKVALFGVLAVALVVALVFAHGTKPQVVEAPRSESGARDDFARQAQEALRAAGFKDGLTYDPERFLLQLGAPDGGLGMTLFLENFHREYQAAPPERRGEVLARLGRVGELPEAAGTYEQARPLLRLVVRSRDTFESFSQQPAAEAPVSWRPVGEVLAEALVQDTPDAMRYVTPKELVGWGISYEQARAVALANLRHLESAPLRSLTLGACGLFTRDSYGASRLLLDDVVRGCEVRGDPVVLVPNRDTVLISGADDATGLLALAEAAEESFQAPRPVDGRALRLTAEGWRPFLPDAGSPARDILERLAFISRFRGYDEQTEQLRQQRDQQGTGVHVSGFVARKDARGRYVSQTVWSSQGETLLPRADVIVFVDESLGQDAPPVAAVRWDAVVRDVGTLLMPDLALYPERYRVRGFPTKEQFQRWKADPKALDVP